MVLHIYVFIGFSILLIGAFFIFIKKSSPKNSHNNPQTFLQRALTTSPEYKEITYTSEMFGITITYPNTYTIKDSYTTILLTHIDKNFIMISRNSTDYKTIQEYFDNLKEKNNLSPLSENRVVINGFPGVLSVIKTTDGTQSRGYSVFVDQSVISFSTSSPELYDDLENIVHSFKYLED